MRKIFGENVGKIMLTRELTQEDLAERSKVSRQTINRAMATHEIKNINLSTAFKIAKALNVAFPQLFSRVIDLDEEFDSNIGLDDYLNVFLMNVDLFNRGKSQKRLSSQPGIGESTISQLLNGEVKDPYLSTLYAISEQVDVPLNKLLIRGG